MMPKGEVTETAITGFHAHVYYTPETKPLAARLRDEAERNFAVVLGHWHDAPIGPHTASMYQIAFAKEEFGCFVPWLMLQGAGLDILIHPLTGNDYDDHVLYGLWLGNKLPLNADVLR
jgi:DOPA 4,5-dioxygenase